MQVSSHEPCLNYGINNGQEVCLRTLIMQKKDSWFTKDEWKDILNFLLKGCQIYLNFTNHSTFRTACFPLSRWHPFRVGVSGWLGGGRSVSSLSHTQHGKTHYPEKDLFVENLQNNPSPTFRTATSTIATSVKSMRAWEDSKVCPIFCPPKLLYFGFLHGALLGCHWA